jgi:hypothetical protein
MPMPYSSWDMENDKVNTPMKTRNTPMAAATAIRPDRRGRRSGRASANLSRSFVFPFPFPLPVSLLRSSRPFPGGRDCVNFPSTHTMKPDRCREMPGERKSPIIETARAESHAPLKVIAKRKDR